MKFRIHQQLAELSKKLNSDSDNLCSNYRICWDSSLTLSEAITSDIQMITERPCFVTSIKFILEDSTYRQSASGCILDIKFDPEDEFTISSECLIDYGKVLLHVKQRPMDSKFIKIADLIEAKYESEFKANLINF